MMFKGRVKCTILSAGYDSAGVAHLPSDQFVAELLHTVAAAVERQVGELQKMRKLCYQVFQNVLLQVHWAVLG